MGEEGDSEESTTARSESWGGFASGLFAVVLAGLVVVWAAMNLLSGGERFAVLVSDKVVGGEEAASALARLFAALGLAAAALAGAFWQSYRGLLPKWLLFAVVLLAGSVLHDCVWPSAYGGDVLTTADALSLAFAVVVAIGGIAELRRVALERAALLANERERARRMDELNAMRSDFSAMIAHELETPIAAIRKLNEMLSDEGEDPATRSYATAATEGELDALTNLVRDVRAVAAVEREDFQVETRPLPLEKLLADAEVYASTLPGQHAIAVMVRGDLSAGACVLADPERIGQVLRNLLSNAAKYSPEGTPIELRAVGKDGRVRIEVADRGQGIHPKEVARIFEKFGRDQKSRVSSGAGLGLYLSQRIVQSHGSKLTVQTRLGEGSVFGFELAVVR